MASLKQQQDYAIQMQEEQERRRQEEQQKIVDELADPAPEPTPQPMPPPRQETAAGVQRKMVFLAHNYRAGTPQWVKPLKLALENSGYLALSPLEPVEEQFEQEHKRDLMGLQTKLVSSLVGFLKLHEDIIAPLESASVIQMIRQADQKTDIESIMFKELYFLTRSSVVICDLIQEPYGFEIYHKLFLCKILDIPTIGISPKGAPLNPYVSKFVKLVLTDDFNVANVLPLVRAYA